MRTSRENYSGNRLTKVVALSTALALGAGAVGIAKGQTGGVSPGIGKPNIYSESTAASAPASSTGPARSYKRSACPEVSKINSKTKISPGCRTYLIKILRKSVYDDIQDNLSVATYQKKSKIGVDGAIGPITAKNILSRKALPKTTNNHSPTKGFSLLIRRSDQTATLSQNGQAKHTFSISSGSNDVYYKDGQRKQANTPTGNFRVTREMDPNFTSSEFNGAPMANAHFFEDTRGIAIHAGIVDYDGEDSKACVRAEDRTMAELVDPALQPGSPVKVI